MTKEPSGDMSHKLAAVLSVWKTSVVTVYVNDKCDDIKYLIKDFTHKFHRKKSRKGNFDFTIQVFKNSSV